MLCPFDQTELRPVERQGVEVDYCPQCRGVWLDRGELDKLIDRTVEALGRAPAGGRSGLAEEREREGNRDRRDATHPYDRLYGRGDRDVRDGRDSRGDGDDRDRDRDHRGDRDDRDRDDDRDGRYGDRSRRRRRESWFEDLFDFG